jgi:predicted transcriptional regulator
MGVVHLPEELRVAVEREVAEGRAESVEAFVEDAVQSALEGQIVPSEELRAVIREGLADLEAGRYVEFENLAEFGAYLDKLTGEAIARSRAEG